MPHLEIPEVAVAVRTLTALVFLSAAYGKFRNGMVFRGVLANYRLLPEALIGIVAAALPPLEALLGAALLLGIATPWSEAAAAALLVVFAAAMGINLIRGRSDIDCGCFQSTLRQTLSWTLVARNLVLASALGLAGAAVQVPLEGWARLEGLLGGGVAFLILQSLNILWTIVPAWHRPRRLGTGVRG
jgi:uncharacterized membrane protein YphA (DoxX/SURF4 family)